MLPHEPRFRTEVEKDPSKHPSLDKVRGFLNDKHICTIEVWHPTDDHEEYGSREFTSAKVVTYTGAPMAPNIAQVYAMACKVAATRAKQLNKQFARLSGRRARE
jgi:hypothetical protein